MDENSEEQYRWAVILVHILVGGLACAGFFNGC